MWKEAVGARSRPVRNVVDPEAVRRFIEATGDANPLYIDEAAAARGRWGRRIAPPTFPVVLDYGAVPGLALPASGLIHGEHGIRYRRPLFVGEAVDCAVALADAERKRGRSGPMTVLVFERTGEADGGERIFTARDVVIVTAAVMRGLASA